MSDANPPPRTETQTSLYTRSMHYELAMQPKNGPRLFRRIEIAAIRMPLTLKGRDGLDASVIWWSLS